MSFTPSPSPDDLYMNSLDGQSILSPKTPEKKDSRSTIFAIWCDKTSCHGIIDWYRSQGLTKWFWGILILTFTVLAIGQIYELICNWTTYPHYVTNVFLKAEDYSEFPNITICNLNRINYTKATSHPWNMTDEAISYLFLSQMTQYEVSSATPIPNSDGVVSHEDMLIEKKAWDEFWPRAQDLGIAGIDDIYRQLGHTCQDSFCMCMFGGHPFDCCSHAKPILNAEFGLCWTITPPIHEGDKTPKQLFPSVSQGFKAWIQPSLQYYANDVLSNNYLQQGIAVAANFEPESFWYPERLVISPGTRAAVHLSNNVFTYNRPMFQIFETDCSLSEGNIHSKGNFSVLNCVADCLQNTSIKACNCMILGEVKDKVKNFCTPDQMVQCVFQKMAEGMASKPGKNSPSLCKCMKTCKIACRNRKEVKMSSSTSVYPSPKQVEKILKYFKKQAVAMHGEEAAKGLGATKEEQETFIKSWIALEMYYTERGYTVIESEAKVAIFTLIGNIGGQLGLWLGVSILTLIQATYYFMKLLCPGRGHRIAP